MDVRKWVERKAIAIGESGTSSDVKLIAGEAMRALPILGFVAACAYIIWRGFREKRKYRREKRGGE